MKSDEDADPMLTPEQSAELDRRVADHEANPDDVVSWAELKAAMNAKVLGTAHRENV
jgi:putative addiction module component (TIGR02574 family)